MRTKAQTEIVEALVLLENTKGHLKWKISELARAANVSRPLIYYHFGRSKQEILEQGIELIAARYFGLTPRTIELLLHRRGWEAVQRTRRMIQSRPSFAAFYLRWRALDSPLQARLVAVERRYQEMLGAAFPHLSSTKVLALHAILHGVVTAPFLTDEAADTIRAVLLHL